MEEQKKQFEKKLNDNKQIQDIRTKIVNIRKEVTEANEIAKFMSKDIKFTEIYISKINSNSSSGEFE
jgi:hypothetical protein